ncbi:efflux RND transporter permease subunit [Thalassotalea nanhaiensis]|uniref:Efflux RND transporter permease subunit n=1 Tax=Thalassotalea nanhaiensis TaxID=3065648 RepID=A0ABY9TH84_9GAMM|nr:efflux RND transporter permease subunit [Colwelliaceae bacterium SQ345]
MSFNPMTWMIRHGIAPNLLMFALLLGGLVMSVVIRKEYMPETTLDSISVTVAYPGASPSEMENSIAVPIEDSLDSLSGIRSIRTSIFAGWVRIKGELEAGADAQQVYQDAQQAVNRISSFPSGMERPKVNLGKRIIDVMEIVVHADLDKFNVKRVAEQIRDRILQSPYISQVKLSGIPREEIHVEIPQSTLQAYNLTLSQVSSKIKRGVIEQSAGKIKADNGDILLSIDERTYWADELEKMPLLSSEQGDQLVLGDIAQVSEGFADERYLVTYNKQLSARLNIYRVGDQSPSDIADSVKSMWPELEAMLPPNAGLSIVDDDATNYQKRLGLLLNNAFMGLLLVLILMSLFLEFKLAFWVVAGIPSAFLGAILLMPSFDVSINMVSMFGFIIALGIVVDDAIIAGENIYAHMEEGMSYSDAAILGAKEVAKPLTFAILTNIVAFLPLLLLPGFMKLLFGAIPVVVVLCFVVSWVEALFILPAHLANIKEKKPNVITAKFKALQKHCDKGLQKLISHYYTPLLKKCLAWPSLTLAIAVLCFVLVMAYAFSGKMGFGLYPKMDGRWVKASFEISESEPLEQAIKLRDILERSSQEMLKRHDAEDILVSTRSIIIDTGVEVSLLLVESEERDVSTEQVRMWWRESSAELNKKGKLRFSGARRGSSAVAATSVTIELRHSDADVLLAATQDAALFFEGIDNVVATVNSMEEGKPEWKLKLNENGRSLGLDAADLAAQMRASLYGARAQRQHRLRNEVTTLVRLPREEREVANNIESLLIHTKGGGYAPLGSVATIEKVLAPSRINRRKGQRIETVGAEVLPEEAIPAVTQAVHAHLVTELEGRYPGLTVHFGGNQEQIAESVSSLELGTGFALAAIYILLAIAFKSYAQPLLIMAVIPFGAIGAILGHMVLGLSLSVVSLMGMLALAGVVVNDSLILVEYANKKTAQGVSSLQAITLACQRRFRPIILTTLTTFGGLAPMVFETSRQAQFVVPMAVSLGFGILFTTIVCLLVLPSLYIVFNKDKQPLDSEVGNTAELAMKTVV